MRGQPGAPSGHPAPGAVHLAEAGDDLGPVHRPQPGARGVVGGQVAGERGEPTEGSRGIGGVEPLRMLGGGQPAGGQGVGEHGGRAVPVGVRGAQLEPRRVTGWLDIGRERTVIAGVGHGPHGSGQRGQTRYVA